MLRIRNNNFFTTLGLIFPLMLMGCGNVSYIDFIPVHPEIGNSMGSKVGADTGKDRSLEGNNVRELLKSGKTLATATLAQPSILSAELAVQEAMQNVELEKAAAGLQADVSLNSGALSIQDDQIGAVGSVTASQIIRDNGVIKSRVLSAKAKAQIAYLYYEEAVAEFLYQAISTFVSYNGGQELLDVTDLRLIEANDIYQKLGTLKNAGQIDETALGDAENTIVRLELLRTDVESELEIRKSELETLFRVPVSEINIDVASMEKLADFLLSRTDFNDPRITQLEQEILALTLERQALSAAKWGTLSLSSRFDVPLATQKERPDASIGLMFSRTLSDGNRQKAMEQSMDLQLESLMARIGAQQQIFDTSDAALRNEIKNIGDSIDLRVSMIETTSNNIRALNDQMIIGMSDFSKILSAKVALFNLERDQVIAKRELLLTKIGLVKLRGQLINLAQVKLPVSQPYSDHTGGS